MKKENNKMKNRFLIIISLCIFSNISIIHAQAYKWLCVGDLQSPFSALGAEYEAEFNNVVGTNSDYLVWQPQYSIDQTICRAKVFLIGCKNFNDPVANVVKNIKVIGTAPGISAGLDQIFPQEIKLIGKYSHPDVIVNNTTASILTNNDVLDEVDPNLPCDRMIVIRFNTSLGISVTKKIMSFSQSNHGSYFVYDFVFKNTGIIDQAGTVHAQALDSVWFFWHNRYAFGGVSCNFGTTWGNFSSTWGISTLNHAIGQDPTATAYNDGTSLLYKLRGFYSYFSPTSSGNAQGLSYAEDWGCPNKSRQGQLASAKYAGCVTLHADKSSADKTDDEYQPKTTWFISPDLNIFHNASPSQYDDAFMSDRWTAITEGHPVKQHDEIIGTTGTYAETYSDLRRDIGGGVAMDQGYGPYHLEVGDSIHIVFAEAAAGIGWERGCTVGSNWLQWRTYGSGPTLTMPDNSTTTDYNAYKKAWIFTGQDSILKTFQTALSNYKSGYTLPQAPPPPNNFFVASGGLGVQLTWANNAKSAPHFGGYVIYRAEGNILNWTSIYSKIFETNDVNLTSYLDTTAKRGYDNYYYIQSKDDGTQVSGQTLYSSLYWTLTNAPVQLGRLPGSAMEQIRVVPNPYDIRARLYQYGTTSQYDRINFYGLPPMCKLKIFTENGELIWQYDHVNNMGSESWDSRTSSGQIVASGVYILYVEVTQDTYDTWVNMDNRLLFKKGDSIYRKLVVIR